MRTSTALLALLLVPGCFEDERDEDESGSTGVASGSSTRAGTSAVSTGSTSDPTSSTITTTSTSTGVADSSATSTAGSSSSGAPACPPDCPTGRCDADARCERVVFVTANAYPIADLGDLTPDQVCMDEAAFGQLPGEFRAFLTGNNEASSAFDHVEVGSLPGAVFVLPDDLRTPVAEVVDTLRVDISINEMLENPINVGPDGDVVGGGATCTDDVTAVWTGMISENELAVGGPRCGNWDGATPNAGIGRFSLLGTGWAATDTCPCQPGSVNDPFPVAHLYCFEVPSLD